MEHKIIDISELTDRQLEMAIAYHCENFTVEEVPNDVNGENGGFILANKALLKKGYTYPPKGKLSASFMTPRYMNDSLGDHKWIGNYHLQIYSNGFPVIIVNLQNEIFIEHKGDSKKFSPSNDWLIIGEAIEKHQIDIIFDVDLSYSDPYYISAKLTGQ